MDESQSLKPHPVIHEGATGSGSGAAGGGSMSIWFFVGVLSLLYGLVLLGYGGWAWGTGHESATVLANLHPTFWWGALLTIFGLFYTLKYRPRPRDRDKV